MRLCWSPRMASPGEVHRAARSSGAPQAPLPGDDLRMPVVPVLYSAGRSWKGSVTRRLRLATSGTSKVPRFPKQLLLCTVGPWLDCRASGLVSASRQGRHDHGSGRGTWLVEGSFLRIVESLRRPRLEAWRRCALERLARWGLYAPQEG